MTHHEAPPPPLPAPPSQRELLLPLLELAAESESLLGNMVGSFVVGGRRYGIPRFILFGPSIGQKPARVALFAGLHGDEPAGCLALTHFLSELVHQPERATGYDLVVYPVCNPTGYEAGTRLNFAGQDLNREFWRGSSLPEIAILERELREHRFDGIITLHADDTSDGLYGYTHGQTLNERLLVPALRAGERHLPLNRGALIDGFSAEDGCIRDCFPGILAPPPGQRPRPFELIFETPARAPLDAQVEANVAALDAILDAHRALGAEALFL